MFELRAKAGQTLALEDGYWPASAKLDPSDVPGLRVFRADAEGSKDIPNPEGFGDCVDWRWMNVLPTSGIYHIVVSRRSPKGYRLRISLLGPAPSDFRSRDNSRPRFYCRWLISARK